ncbi:MAG: DUF2252 family protein [Amaricoccus sp.]
MTIIEETTAYERWLADHCPVVADGLREKHEKMAKSPFRFFRATCYRFARVLPGIARDRPGAPIVPSVGDAHVENFGTWRDDEGRLVWGINDFDEAAALPWSYDLMRLATSARLAPAGKGRGRERVEAILEGYRQGLDRPGPCIVDGSAPWMAPLLTAVLPKDEDTGAGDPVAEAEVPGEVRDALVERLPAGAHGIAYSTRQRGAGSLGRPRYLATGLWRGGAIVREAKALVPSAWDWAASRPGPVGQFLVLATGRYRAPDPFLAISAGYVIRRIAADSRKIDIGDAAERALDGDLLRAMGADLASIHVSGRVTAEAIRADLKARDKDWLREAAKALEASVEIDFRLWREARATDA